MNCNLNESLDMNVIGVRPEGFVVERNGKTKVYTHHKLSPKAIASKYYKLNQDKGPAKAWEFLTRDCSSSEYAESTPEPLSKPKISVKPRPTSPFSDDGNIETDNKAKNNEAINKPHNQKAYKEAVDAIEREGTCCIVQSTGTGKSSIATSLIDDYSDSPCFAFAPTEGINTQFTNHNKDNNVSKNNNLHTMTYPGLLADYKKGFPEVKSILGDKKVGFAFLDELHRTGATQWNEALHAFIDTFVEGPVVGATATPTRSDGTDPSEEFNKGIKVSNLTLESAIAQGILPLPKYHNFPSIDDEEIASIYDQVSKLDPDVEKEALDEIDDLIGGFGRKYKKEQEKYFAEELRKIAVQKKSGGIKLLGFCSDSKDAENGTGKSMVDIAKKAFPEKKIVVHSCVSGHMNSDDEKFLKDFQEKDDVPDNEVHICLSVNLFNEGIHAKGVDTIFMGRHTESDIIFSQELGRVLAIEEGKQANIFDMVNNGNDSSHDMEAIYNAWLENHDDPDGEYAPNMDDTYPTAMSQAKICLSHYKKNGQWRAGKLDDGTWDTLENQVNQLIDERGENGRKKSYYTRLAKVKLEKGASFSEAIKSMRNSW